MANYYYVTIKSDKMTQEVASEILQRIATKNRIRSFNFNEGGCFHYNTRGLTDITDILNKYDFVDNEIEIKDEFELVYESLSEGEIQEMIKKAEENPIEYKGKKFEF